MHIVKRTRTFVRGFMKSYGPSGLKKRLWDEEFSGTHWDFINDTAGDCVYAHLEKYAAGGSILDLGCGPGNTANELATASYRTYVGVDISEAALSKAAKRTEQNGRSAKNSFALSDFISYTPTQQFDVILFRESLYHMPLGRVRETLRKFSSYLTSGGVFIVRIVAWDASINSSQAKLDLIEAEFDVLEKHEYGDRGPTVLVFKAGGGRQV